MRDNYDVLSETGVHQARLLGDWIRTRSGGFDAVVSGALQRQRQTAELAFDGAAMDLVVDPGWNEFDLDAVFAAYVPLLAEAEPGFGERYGAIQKEIAQGGLAIHREWRPADGEVVIAWMTSRFGEIAGVDSWPAFRDRIRGALQSLGGMRDDARVAVSTSALPIGIVVAEVFGLDSGAALNLAATMHNTGLTVISLEGGAPQLVSFNATGHLGAELLTRR